MKVLFILLSFERDKKTMIVARHFPECDSECPACSCQLSKYRRASALSRMISKFSAFFSSAALVKLKLPGITVSPSMIMTLLWAMAWRESIWVGIPEFTRKNGILKRGL